MTYWVYILASKAGGNTIHRRDKQSCAACLWASQGLGGELYQAIRHQNVSLFEPHETIAAALQREKNIKHWSREWKIDLIVASNPDWRDLYEDIVR
jgi:putative endonuclease